MLQKLTLVLAILAMLIPSSLTINSLAHPAMPAPDMQTITLNTGFNHDTQKTFAIGTPDVFWSVIKDPIAITNESRAADTILKHNAWKPPQGTNESQWISYTTNGSKDLQAGPYYYQKCFCLTKALWDNKAAIAQSSLDVSVLSDDGFYLGLNLAPGSLGPSSNHLTHGGGAGGFSGAPAVLKITGDKLVSLLRPGRNCLTVRVDDIGGVITGFNLAGSLTTTGIEGIARATKSGPQFDRCSSCQGTKTDMESEIKSKLQGAGRGDLVRQPEK